MWGQWAEDERLGPTPHQRLEALDSLASQAANAGPDERDRVARKLTGRYRSESDPLFRAAVVRALGDLPSPAAAEGLTLALEDSDPDVRITACEAWRRLGGPEALRVLTRVLNESTDLDVRLAATRELGALGDPAAAQSLGLALDDPNPALQWRAVQSLKAVSGRDFGDNLSAWRQFARGGVPHPPENPSLAERLRSLF
jgi:HEAT repeat protein